MDLGVISSRYAKALLLGATSSGEQELVYRDMQQLSRSYIDQPRLRQAIDNPMLPQTTKRQLLRAACGGDPAKVTDKWLELVLSSGREGALQFMASSFVTLYRRQSNIITGRLTTAVPMTDDTAERMRRMVENRAGAHVEFTTQVDPSLIGGFVLEYDTFRMDASIKSQLARVKAQLITH